MVLLPQRLDTELVHDTLNVLLKFEADIEVANKQIATLTQKARQEAGCRVRSQPPSRKEEAQNSPSPCERGLGGAGPTSEPLRQFLQAARSVGIRVSAAE